MPSFIGCNWVLIGFIRFLQRLITASKLLNFAVWETLAPIISYDFIKIADIFLCSHSLLGIVVSFRFYCISSFIDFYFDFHSLGNFDCNTFDDLL